MPLIDGSPVAAAKDAYDLVSHYEWLQRRRLKLKEETNAVHDQINELEARIVDLLKKQGDGKVLIAGDRVYRSDGFRIFGSDAFYAVSVPIDPPATLDNCGGESGHEFLERLKAEAAAEERRLLTSYRPIEDVSQPELKPNGKDA